MLYFEYGEIIICGLHRYFIFGGATAKINE